MSNDKKCKSCRVAFTPKQWFQMFCSDKYRSRDVRMWEAKRTNIDPGQMSEKQGGLFEFGENASSLGAADVSMPLPR